MCDGREEDKTEMQTRVKHRISNDLASYFLFVFCVGGIHSLAHFIHA